MSDVKRRYSQTEKEALGLVWACKRFSLYVLSIKLVKRKRKQEVQKNKQEHERVQREEIQSKWKDGKKFEGESGAEALR